MRSLIALLVALTAAPVHAQVIEIGGALGGTSSGMYQTYDCPPPESEFDLCPTRSSSNRNRRGLAASIYARYPLTRALLVQAQLVYAQKGYESTQPTIHVDYLELPILFRVDPIRAQNGPRLFVQAGLAPALRVWCTASGQAAVANPSVDPGPPLIVSYDRSCEDAMQFHPTDHGDPAWLDLGGVFAVGVGWESPIGLFEIEARLTKGLIDNNTWGADGPTKNDSTYVLFSFGRSVAR